jgi:hypothetical protein
VPWLKVSDRFATHPLLLRLRTVQRADERTTNEVIGWLTRCSAQSACYLTDYYIDLPTAELFGGARTQLLLTQATKAGLLTPTGRGAARRWRIIDEEDLFHIRAREDVEWERQRDKDRRNIELRMPVLARDGDQCRYCLVVVNWKDTRSGRGGTFDHRQPGQAATVDTYVVACRSCNGKRKDVPNADSFLPLQLPPTVPYFSPRTTTRKDLEAHYGRSFPSATEPRPAIDPAAPGATRQGTAAARPTTDPAPAATGAAPAPREHDGPTWAQPTTAEPPWSEAGRPVGSGQVRTEGDTTEGTTPPPRRSRGRRGRRGTT